VSKVVNNIELATITLSIEQSIHELSHTVMHTFDSFRSELAHYQATEAIVIGWIKEDEWLMSLSRFDLLGQFTGAASTLAFIRTDARIMQQCYDFTISANYICTIFLLRDWSCTQLRVEWVRIWAVGWFEDLLEQFPLIHEVATKEIFVLFQSSGGYNYDIFLGV
jgi:hypothetical protein